MLNCKQGDLAVIVRDAYRQENLGKICRCVRYIGDFRGNHDVWEVDTPMVWTVNGENPVLRYKAPDNALKPIPPLNELEGIADHRDLTVEKVYVKR